MTEINLALVVTVIGIESSIQKFANLISEFGYSVDGFSKSMQELIDDQQDLQRILNEHSCII